MIGLSRRERQVLTGMSVGLSTADMALLLALSENTVKIFRGRLFRKLQARNRTHAVALGFRAGWLS